MKKEKIYEHPEEYGFDPEKYEKEMDEKKPKLFMKREKNEVIEKVQEKVESGSFSMRKVTWVIISVVLILFVLQTVLPVIEEVSEDILSDYPKEEGEAYYQIRKIIPLVLIAGFIILIMGLFSKS